MSEVSAAFGRGAIGESETSPLFTLEQSANVQ